MSKKMKEYMKLNCASGYEYHETTFEELSLLLSENAAYSPFQFKEGKRSKANIISGAKFVVLDIDKSKLSDKEVHMLLDTYNHHIARTSDPENKYKYRVLIELDAVVDVEDRMWSAFIEEIAIYLGLIIDNLPKSQIFFAFEGREVLTQLEGQPMAVKPLLDRAAIRLRDKPKPAKDLTPAIKSSRLNDPRSTFDFAFEAEQGGRSVKMYRALAYAIDLGADKEYVENLAHEIDAYWVVPLDPQRLQNTLIEPALRRM